MERIVFCLFLLPTSCEITGGIVIDHPVAFVGVNDRGRISLLPVSSRLSNMSKEEAVDLAVRLVAVSDDRDEPAFGGLLREYLDNEIL